MSVYEWPSDVEPESGDDPEERARAVAPRYQDFDREGAVAAGRTTALRGSRRARRGVAFAPPSGPHNLWVPLGPATMLGGQAANKPRVAGRVRALAVDDDGERIYAAAANGGIWYSSNAGASWRSIGGLAATDADEVKRPAHRHASGAIAVRFRADEDDTVFVGTGELNPDTQARPGSSLGGIGILVSRRPVRSTLDDPWTREAPTLAGHGIHRIALEPGGDGVLAATSIGLFVRPASPGIDVDWTKVTVPPFDTFTGRVTDVLWTDAHGGRPKRQWVWLEGGAQSGLWVRNAGADRFTQIATPGIDRKRGVLAASTPPTRVYALNNRYDQGESPAQMPALYRIDATADPPTAAAVIAGVPDVLRDQGHYDMAIEVDPGEPDRIVIAGSWIDATNPAGATYESYNGSLMSAVVGDNAGTLTFGHPNPPTMIGVGVHADVHDLAFAKNRARLFVSCDGGVYRSDRPTQQVGFVACNDGLSIAEANYVASHPVCDGHVVVGLQDNGSIERSSNGVWRIVEVGDGGGAAFDPSSPSRYLTQYIRASWRSNGFRRPLERGGATLPASDAENSASSFYSTPGASGHARGANTVGQIIVGTDRVWYTEDWGVNWVTLPTGTDPITATTNNRAQDQFPEAVFVCKWQNSDVAWVLTQDRWTADARRVVRLSRTPGSADAGGPGTWSRDEITILVQSGKRKKNETSTETPLKRANAWTDLAVNLEAGGEQRGTKGAIYLGTAGHPTDEQVDTLWWFDGTRLWHKTGLRQEGAPAPVTAVICDPAHPEHVYVGTTVGVWRGTRTIPSDGSPPDWAWLPLNNGLPEAVVEDLSLYSHAGVRLLRAAIAARGLWELELDALVSELTYLRVHDDDLRRRDEANVLARDGTTTRSWHGSPDVRPRPVPLPIAAPGTLPWRRGSSNIVRDTLQRFQAALRAKTGDPRVRATGVWDLYFEEVLRDHGAPLTANVCRIDNVPPAAGQPGFWDSVMSGAHATAEPWGAGPPSEADLQELTPRLTEGGAGRTSATLNRGAVRVDVVVHHRGLAEVDGANVRVTLLRWSGTVPAVDPDDASTWFAGDVPWTAAVNDVLNSDGGTTSAAPGTGWAFALPGPNRRLTLAGQRLDGLRSGVASFDVDLSGITGTTSVLLVAVIRAGTASALPAAPLRDLVLREPTVAVRSLRVDP